VSDGTPELNAALAKLQAKLPRITKGETAKIPGKNGAQGYSYKYADLADISQVVIPLLGSFGLSFTSKPTMADGAFVLVYTLRHESGESDEGFYPLPDPRSTGPREVGSAITYARRYCLCAATGVHPDGEDDDAGAAQQGWQQSASSAFDNASGPRPDGNGQQRQWKPREKAADGAGSQQERRQEPKRPAGQDLGDWDVKVAEIATPDDVIAIKDEVTQLYDRGALEAERANEIRRAIDARVAELRGRARQAQQQPADGAEPAQDAGDGESAWAVDFTGRAGGAGSYEDIRGLKLELARAVKDKTVTPEIANELGDVLKNRQNELRSAA
jgi:hypothetical protein